MSDAWTIAVEKGGIARRLHSPVVDSTIKHCKLIYFDRLEDKVRGKLLIIIGTPPRFHFERISTYGILSDIIICEKPMGHNIEAAEEIVRWKNKHHKYIIVNYQLRYLTVTNWLIGRASEILKVIYKSCAWKEGTRRRWYKSPDEGGTVIYTIGSHIVDMMRYIGRETETLRELGDGRWRNGAGAAKIGLQDRTGVVLLDIDLESEAEEFAIVGGTGENLWYADMVSGNISKVIGCKYPCGTLSSETEGIWRIGFRDMIKEIISKKASINDGLARWANSIDALFVHDLIKNFINNPK